MPIKRTLSFVLALVMMCAFSIHAFAGYDFSENGNTNNTSYNGTNDVYSNGIYVGTDPVTGLPIYKFEMDNISNTYNGETNIHGNGDALFDGYDQYGTYNGTLDVIGTDVGPGTTTTISNANINAVTSISAADAVTDNDLNAGVLIQDSTFTNDVTIQSSTVNLSSDANVILGSSSQMDSLLTKTDTTNTKLDTIISQINTYIKPYLQVIRESGMIIKDNLTVNRQTNSPTTVTLSNNSTLGSVSYNLTSYFVPDISYVDGEFINTNTTVYCNFAGMYRLYLHRFMMFIYAAFNYMYDRLDDLYDLLTTFFNYFVGNKTYQFYVFNTVDQYFTISTENRTGSWRDVIINRFNTIIGILSYQASRFYEWYYPLDGSAPYYWRTYNSDTDEEESVNIARVLYDISWYLGHITIGDDIADEVESLSDNLTSYQQAEQNLQNRVSSSIQNFIPDVNLFSGLNAISFVRTWLQNIYLALGSYGSVMMVGLLLGVCMQFIGYFRYKF